MKESRLDRYVGRNNLIAGVVGCILFATVAYGSAEYKARVDEGAAQPDCVVAVGSDDTLDSLDEEITEAGDRHHYVGAIVDSGGLTITREDRPELNEDGDIEIYLGDNVVFYFVGRTACDVLQSKHNDQSEPHAIRRMTDAEIMTWQQLDHAA